MTPREKERLHDLGVYLGIYEGDPSMIEGWLCEERWDENKSVSVWYFWDDSKPRKQFRYAVEVSRYLGLQVSHAPIQSFSVLPLTIPIHVNFASVRLKPGARRSPRSRSSRTSPGGPRERRGRSDGFRTPSGSSTTSFGEWCTTTGSTRKAVARSSNIRQGHSSSPRPAKKSRTSSSGSSVALGVNSGRN